MPRLRLLVLLLLLSDNLSCIKFNEHGAIGFQLFHGNGESEVI